MTINILNLANQITEAWDDFSKWYEFGGGKEKIRRDEIKERNDALMLKETKSVADLWRTICFKHQDGESLKLIEEVVEDTAKLEWGEDIVVDFDYSKQKVIVHSREQRVEI